MSHPATLLHITHGPDISITTVDKPGSGTWTIVSHVAGWDRIVSPIGSIIDCGPESHISSPIAAEVIQDCINHIW